MPEELKLDEITSYRKNLEFDAKDDDLVLAINTAVQESKDLKEKMDEIGKINKKYWKDGTAKDLSRLHPKKPKTVTNRIFVDVETSIPILTSEVPEPTVVGATDNTIQQTIQKGLQIAYEVKYRLQQKLQTLIRQWYLYRIGVLKYRWDKEKGFTTEPILARKIGFDRRATSKANCEYVWEELEDTIENLITKFKSKEKEITTLIGNQDNKKAKIKYLEFWGGNGKWVCWKLRTLILDKKKNPNFDYGTPEQLTAMGHIPAQEGVNNVFEKPEFPYLFLNVFSIGDETGLYDETSIIEEAASLQEGANQLEQQILELNEGQKRVWVLTNVAEEVAQDLINKTGDLAVRTKQPNAATQVQSGKPDAALFNHLAHLLSEIDNIFGIHSTTRGASPQRQETLGAQKLQTGQDYGRQDLIVRNVEQLIEEWYNAYLHCIKVFSVEAEVLNNGKETIELTREMIPQGIQVMVKKGSTLPIDRQTKMANAIQLAQFQMIDPKTLFQEMGYPNEDQRVQDLFQWLAMTGKIQMPEQPISPEQQTDQAKLEQIKRARQMMETAKGLPPEEQSQVVGQIQQTAQTI